MHHFFVSPEHLQGDTTSFSGCLARQLSRVLRLSPGDHIVLLDDSGRACEAELDAVVPERVTAHLVGVSEPQTEPSVELVLYQALPKGKKFDWILQKGTELGVSTFVPILTQRCVARGRTQDDEHKLARWRRILTEAAEQSGRAHLPKIVPTRSFVEACEPPPCRTLALMAGISDEATSLSRALSSARNLRLREVRLFVGPEGGFAQSETSQAQHAGIVPVSLGPRVLRTETAGLVALSVVLYALGDLG